jgi:hypothetical protein
LPGPGGISAQTLGTILTLASCTALSRAAYCWGILVRDGADEVVPPAVDDLVRMRSDDDLVNQHLDHCAPINSRQILTRQ